VDIYSQNSVSIRAENDLNFRADQDIILDAGGNIRGTAGGAVSFKSGANTEIAAGGSFISSAGGDLTHKAGGNIAQSAGGTAARTAASIKDNSGGPAAPAASAPGGVNRMPAHEPWPYHPGATSMGAQIGSGDGINHDADRVNASGDNAADEPTTGSGRLGGGADKLAGVHPDLVRVVRRAATITTCDFRVLEGLRTRARQVQLVRSGASKTMNSRHLTGHAVDLGALVGGKISWAWPHYNKIARAMKEAARLERVEIEWGGDWRSFKDGPHFQLSWARYPR
jgi:peptidoglycan L-alanyl-D-glutamate endopeptidase CwlK